MWNWTANVGLQKIMSVCHDISRGEMSVKAAAFRHIRTYHIRLEIYEVRDWTGHLTSSANQCKRIRSETCVVC